MRYTVEVFMKEGTPLVTEECEEYFFSQDGLRLHLKKLENHIVIPMSNVLFVKAHDQEATN